ncbi:hypothetical protein K2173_026401 [Erythroxylum novogranatense]|uniref:Uncharacterized protein n=1 Tax=Erythroxylum novogranatense TaxID=1862640 RepID=A0AAV8SNX2_9ROSI|nr:hypothetical protein K2173_026401 [Erythroxylum novogranatense]
MDSHQHVRPQLSLKLVNGPIQLRNFIFYLIIFGSALFVGFTFCFFLNQISFNFLHSQFSAQNPPIRQSLSSPIPRPPPCLPSVPTETKPRIRLNEFLGQHNLFHGMEEEELLWRASLVPRILEFPVKVVPKVAFLFLSRGSLGLAALWELFFKGHEGFYTIYWHTGPGLKETVPESSVFYGRQIPSQEVRWGQNTMIEAERRLLANALLDFSNRRFVLISESCIPLYNFSTIYTYLMGSAQSFVSVYNDLPSPEVRRHYRSQMRPVVQFHQWQKGSQWFQMNRHLAVEVVSDTTYFPMFQKFCTSPCVSDEHYLPTFVYIKFGKKNANRTLTWVDWSRGGPHPRKFGTVHVTVNFLEWIRNSTTCRHNGQTTNVCYLFARKFSPDALEKLLELAATVMKF